MGRSSPIVADPQQDTNVFGIQVLCWDTTTNVWVLECWVELGVTRIRSMKLGIYDPLELLTVCQVKGMVLLR